MAGLCPDLLGELTVLHRTPSWIKGCPPPPQRGWEDGRGMRDRVEAGKGREGRFIVRCEPPINLM